MFASAQTATWMSTFAILTAHAAREQRNTNGLLRQYFPKTDDLSLHSAAHLNAVGPTAK
jgi:hypothetical protein